MTRSAAAAIGLALLTIGFSTRAGAEDRPSEQDIFGGGATPTPTPGGAPAAPTTAPASPATGAPGPPSTAVSAPPAAAPAS